MTTTKESPAPRANAGSRANIEAEHADNIDTREAAQSDVRMALAGDALGDAARLIAVNGHLAEGAARDGDEAALCGALPGHRGGPRMTALAIEPNGAETASPSYRLALAGDALADAARLIACQGLLARKRGATWR